MKRGRIRLVWVMPFVVGLLIVAFMVVSPILLSGAIEKFHIRNRAEEAIEKLTGGEASLGNVTAAIFPTPHMVVSQSHVSIPDKLQLEVKRIDIYPRLLYLLQGKLLLSTLTFEKARIKMVIPRKTNHHYKPLNLKSFKIPTIWFALPPLKNLSLRDCLVSLHTSLRRKPFLVLSPINLSASLNHNRLKLKLRVQTNHGEEIWSKGEGDLFLNRAQVKLEVTNLQPHLWLRELGAPLPREFRKGMLNLNLLLRKTGERITVEGVTSIPSLTFKTKDTPKEVTVSLPKAAGKWERYKEGWNLELSEVRLKYPPAVLRVTASSFKTKRKREAKIEVNASTLDLGALREWLRQVPPVYHYLHNLFDVVHGGTAKNLRVGFKGKRFSDISNIRLLTIDGKVENALVMIPKVKLPVKEVRGTLHMENATLTGTGIGGRFLSSTIVENCGFSLLSLKVKNNMHPFHIHLEAHGDNMLQDLMPVLKRVIHDQAIIKELNRMEVKGSASLHLFLGDYLERLHADARTRDLQGVVKYQAIPFPVELEGGEGGFHNGTIYWKGVKAKIGNTKVEALTGSLFPLSHNPGLSIKELRASLEMEELRYWLNRYPVLRPYTSIFPSTKGNLQVESCTLEGPLLTPRRWRFIAKTVPHNLNFTFTLLPFPVTLNGGLLTLTRQRLVMERVTATGGGSRMMLSGWVKNYIGTPTEAEVSYSGKMGKPLYLFLARLSQAPKPLWLNTPFNTTGKWRWKGGPDHALKAEARWPSGELATVDLSSSQRGIRVKEASIASRGDLFKARVTMPFDSAERVEVGFTGKVNYRDLENVFVDHGFLAPGGFVVGRDFYTTIDLHNPKKSSFKGDLKVKNARLNGYFIRDLQALGTPTGLQVNHAYFSYGGGNWNATATLTLSQPLHLSGMVEGPLLRIAAGEPPAAAEKGEGRAEGPEAEKTAPTPSPLARYLASLEGTVSLKIGRVEYGNYTVKGFAGTLSILGEESGVEVRIRKGEICSIPITGRVKIPVENHGQSTYQLHIAKRKLPEEEQPRFEKVIPCLFPGLEKREPLIEGPFRVWGEIKARDVGDGEPLNHLSGYLRVKSTPKERLGLIHKFSLTSKLLDILNPLDMAKNLPKLTVQGIPYSKLLVKIEFEGETWPIQEMTLDGPALKIVATGKLKKGGREIDATILVGMLKTVSRILKNIPLVNTVVKHVLTGKHGSILSIPVQVSGPIEDPLVVPLSPTAVGSEVFGIVKRTLKLPVKLLSPLMPQGNDTHHER